MILPNRKLLFILILSTIVLSFFYIWTVIDFKKPYKINEPPQPTQQALSSSNFDDNIVVIYNRVPKTGSTTFVNVTYGLCRKNRFHVLHINVTGNNHVLSLPNQLSFVKNVTFWNEMKPAFYHGHMAFLDFSKFGMSQKPLYINLIRKPLDRLVSYYYFLRYGDDYRPHLSRHRKGENTTFDECVKLKKPDCDPKNMWLQVPFFCGQFAECFVPGSKWALQQAKRNLVSEYFLVGMTEELDIFIEMLELSLPRLFSGAMEFYNKSKMLHLRKTKGKVDPLPITETKIKESLVWKMEDEFYNFAYEHFQFLRGKYIMSNGKKQDFMYEKIKPPPNIQKTV